MEPVSGYSGRLDRPVSSWPVGVAAAVGLVVAAGMTVLVGWIAPDQGPTSISLRQGLGYGIVFAAAPLAVLLARAQASSAGLGGGMFVAGAATLPGGNFGGLVMLLPGCSSCLSVSPAVRRSTPH